MSDGNEWLRTYMNVLEVYFLELSLTSFCFYCYFIFIITKKDKVEWQHWVLLRPLSHSLPLADINNQPQHPCQNCSPHKTPGSYCQLHGAAAPLAEMALNL